MPTKTLLVPRLWTNKPIKSNLDPNPTFVGFIFSATLGDDFMSKTGKHKPGKEEHGQGADDPAAGGKPTYKVFVSSTYLDNRERRKVVQDAIAMAGMVWHGMEIFPASTRPVVEECLRCAREADILLGIIGWRYGWEPDGKKSITEMEYDAARERLMFQLDTSILVNPEKDYDPGPDWWKKLGKLEAFKKRF
ncbi:MAG: DUF4062 domain-containing protein, partial [bacterium]|nr:DUF4062 domain-containing protein [bacterium]